MIQLSREDIDFMLEVLDLSPDLRQALEGARVSRGPLADDDADEVRDRCGEKLQASGLGPDYEPTALGRRLEQLIDRLFTG